MRTPQAILWDMDGTLIDSEPYWQQAEFDLVAQHGGVWTMDDALNLVGYDLHDAAKVLQHHGVDLEVDKIVNFLITTVSTRISRHVPWRDHAAETLAWVRHQRIPCALVTMSHTPIAQTFVDSAPHGTFDAVITGDMVPQGKPHPDPYVIAARTLGVDVTECIAIEDSPTGITSAMAAGARTIAIQAIIPVQPRPHLSRIQELDQLTPSVLDVVMHGATIDFLTPG